MLHPRVGGLTAPWPEPHSQQGLSWASLPFCAQSREEGPGWTGALQPLLLSQDPDAKSQDNPALGPVVDGLPGWMSHPAGAQRGPGPAQDPPKLARTPNCPGLPDRPVNSWAFSAFGYPNKQCGSQLPNKMSWGFDSPTCCWLL